MLSGQGPASCLNCPAILVLEFQSTVNEFGKRTLTLSHSRDPRMAASVVLSVGSAMGND